MRFEVFDFVVYFDKRPKSFGGFLDKDPSIFGWDSDYRLFQGNSGMDGEIKGVSRKNNGKGGNVKKQNFSRAEAS